MVSNVTVLPSPLCWTVLSRAFLKPLFLIVAVLPEPPSIVTASSQMYGNQTLSIVQLPRQWMPSPTLVPKMTFFTEPPSATSKIAFVLLWPFTEQSSSVPCTVFIPPSKLVTLIVPEMVMEPEAVGHV